MRKAQSIGFILAALTVLVALIGSASGAVMAAPLFVDTPTPSNTPTNTPTPSNTPSNTPTNTPSNTPSNTPTGTLSATPTPSNTPTGTLSPTPTATPTVTGTPPTATPTRQIVLGSPTPIRTPLLPEAGSIDSGEASFGTQGVLLIGALLLAIGFIWMANGRRRAA
jgi:uncharacterized membrane protein